MGLEELVSRGLWPEAYLECMRLRRAGVDVPDDLVVDICAHVEGIIAYGKNCCIRVPMEDA